MDNPGTASTSLEPLSTADHVTGLLQRHCRRLVELQGPVLANRDSEPLHQMRVAMRRLRTCLDQFGPCLVLPKSVSGERLAKSVRQLGLARDLDVLRERLEEAILPQLSEAEQQRLKPVRRQLAKERRQAQEHLETVLRSNRHLKLIAQLQHWLKRPQLSPLASGPLRDWLPEWCLASSAALMLHPGWWLQTPDQDPDCLHDLRKQIKGVRYRLENLEQVLPDSSRPWIASLKQAQGLLGDLNDLTVLEQAIDNQLQAPLAKAVPELLELLTAQRHQSWQHWRELATPLLARPARLERLQGLLEAGSACEGQGITQP